MKLKAYSKLKFRSKIPECSSDAEKDITGNQ